LTICTFVNQRIRKSSNQHIFKFPNLQISTSAHHYLGGLPDGLQVMGIIPLFEGNIYFNGYKRVIAFEMESDEDDRNTATRTYAERGTAVGMALIILLIMMLGSLIRLLIVYAVVSTW
jgi:hypothetical protein